MTAYWRYIWRVVVISTLVGFTLSCYGAPSYVVVIMCGIIGLLYPPRQDFRAGLYDERSAEMTIHWKCLWWHCEHAEGERRWVPTHGGRCRKAFRTFVCCRCGHKKEVEEVEVDEVLVTPTGGIVG